MTAESSSTVQEYIAEQPETTQVFLNEIRKTILEAVPEASESISYAIPTYKVNGKALIHFGAFESHIGLYATPDGHAEFEPELSRYKRGKGSVQFPLDEPMPLDLIKRISIFRAQQLTGGE